MQRFQSGLLVFRQGGGDHVLAVRVGGNGLADGDGTKRQTFSGAQAAFHPRYFGAPQSSRSRASRPQVAR
jgi:hypothetical protein